MNFSNKQLHTYIRRYPAIFLLTFVIIMIQLLTYRFGNGPTDIETARRFGAIQNDDIEPEEWYRLVTYLFVQIGGGFHLLANLSSLIVLGPTIERIYGSAKFTLLFFATGLFGGLFILGFSENVIAAGASGSIFGLMGIYLGLIIQKNRMIDYKSKKVIYSIFLGNIIYTFAMPNISIAAHLGGLCGGFILSFLIRPQSFQRLAKTSWIQAVVQIVIVTILCFSVLLLPNFIKDSTLESKIATTTEKLKSIDLPEFNNGFLSGLNKQNDSPTSNEEEGQENSSEPIEQEEQKDPSALIKQEEQKDSPNSNETFNEPNFKILHVNSGVKEGWIDTSDNFYDEVSITIQVENNSEKTVDIVPEMFILSDSTGYTPSLFYEEQNFDYIPLSPKQHVTFDLIFAINLKTTTGKFLLSVSNWTSYDKFEIDYAKLLNAGY